MYQIAGLLRFPKLFHAFSEKDDGNMASAISGRVWGFNRVVRNRENFLKKLKISMDSCICMWVTHGDEIITASAESAGKSMNDHNLALRLDGLVTNEKKRYLFLNVADCLPIILYDPIKEVAGVVHAGWKGVDLEIVKKAITKMQKEFSVDPSNVAVGIGPCARKESFVKEDPSQKKDPRWQPFIKQVGENKSEIDLVGFAKKQLVDAGVLENNIFDCYIDTVKDIRFFSHSREKDLQIEQQGRFACVIGLV